MKHNKKILLMSLVITTNVFLASAVFSADVKSYLTFAYNYNIFTERADNIQTELNAHGIDLSLSSYFGGNLGLYLNTNYIFPSKATVTSGGSSATITSSDWDFSMLISAILGPTYKFSINSNIEILGALGLHAAEYVLSTDYVSTLNFSFGIGGDIGIRFLPTENFYITGGCLFSHDFYQTGETKTAYGTTKTSDSYNFGSFRPYIGIGIIFAELLK